jgi:hypothetical protein
MALGQESREQIALFQWIRLHPKLKHIAYHVPNERKTSKISGFILKQLGVLSGVSDVVIPVARGGFHGMYIEMKSTKGRLSENQKSFLDNMAKEGYMAVCAHGFDSAKQFIEGYLKLPDSVKEHEKQIADLKYEMSRMEARMDEMLCRVACLESMR